MKKIILIVFALILLGGCQNTKRDRESLIAENEQLKTDLVLLKKDYDDLQGSMEGCNSDTMNYQKEEEIRIKNASNNMINVGLLDKLNTQDPDLSVVGSSKILGTYTIKDNGSVLLFYSTGKLIEFTASLSGRESGDIGILGEYSYTFDLESNILKISGSPKYMGEYIVEFLEDRNVIITAKNNLDLIYNLIRMGSVG